MSIEDNKQLVRTFFKHLEAQNAEGVLSLLTEDATWWVPTDQIGGATMPKSAMSAILPAMYSVYSKRPKIWLGRMTAEGDRVCVEQTAREGLTKGGLVYENDYLMFFVLEGKLIKEIREYLNPIPAARLAVEVEPVLKARSGGA